MSTKLTFLRERDIVYQQDYATLRKDEVFGGIIVPFNKWKIYKKDRRFLRVTCMQANNLHILKTIMLPNLVVL